MREREGEDEVMCWVRIGQGNTDVCAGTYVRGEKETEAGFGEREGVILFIPHFTHLCVLGERERERDHKPLLYSHDITVSSVG